MMRLHSPQSAILSAVIFNALVIIALIPLALRGVQYTPSSASKLLSRNLYIYGLGGIIAPFIGIKLIDLVVQFIPGMGRHEFLQSHSSTLGGAARAAGADRHHRLRLPAVRLGIAFFPGCTPRQRGRSSATRERRSVAS